MLAKTCTLFAATNIELRKLKNALICDVPNALRPRASRRFSLDCDAEGEMCHDVREKFR
jgi:hypothetical protein